VVRKFLDDGGTREAALITYYGFLSIFPILLLGVTVLSEVLVQRPDLRQQLVEAMVPAALQADVTAAAGALPGSGPALVAGLVGLLFSGTGVVFSAYRTLNHVAAVPYRLRSGLVSCYLRVTAVLVLILAGAVTTGGLTVVIAVFPGTPRVMATLGSALVVLAVLLPAARLLLDRPAPMAALWPAALPGAVLVTLMLHLGAVLLPALVRRAGAVYGSFATVAGMFTLLYLLSLALVLVAEVAAVRRARLWPRAVDSGHPTEADARALALLAKERELLPGQRIESRLQPGPDHV
jgi:membrane protein